MTTIYTGLDIAKLNLQLHLAGRLHDLTNTAAGDQNCLTHGQLKFLRNGGPLTAVFVWRNRNCPGSAPASGEVFLALAENRAHRTVEVELTFSHAENRMRGRIRRRPGRACSHELRLFASNRLKLAKNRQINHKLLVFKQIWPVVCQSTEVVC
jgi:hypothetical protein